MDTVLDFSLAKSAHDAAATGALNAPARNLNLNLESLNLSALSQLVFKNTNTSAWLTHLQPPLPTPQSQPHSGNETLLKKLELVLNGINDARSFNAGCNLLPQLMSSQRQTEMNSYNFPASNVLSALAQHLAQANTLKNSTVLCDSAVNCGDKWSSQFTSGILTSLPASPIRQPAKRAKFTDNFAPISSRNFETSGMKCGESSPPVTAAMADVGKISPEIARHKSPQLGSTQSFRGAGSAHPISILSSTHSLMANIHGNIMGDEEQRAGSPITQLAPSSPAAATHAPATSSRASSLTSASSCVSSAQNSPSSASLRRHSSASSSAVTAAAAAAATRTPQRRAAAPVPDKLKDEAYYERRQKNNVAAKRSRDNRRRKEEETAQIAANLHQENTQLRTQVCLLQAEIKKLHALLITNGSSQSPGQTLAFDETNRFVIKSSFSPMFKPTGAGTFLTNNNDNPPRSVRLKQDELSAAEAEKLINNDMDNEMNEKKGHRSIGNNIPSEINALLSLSYNDNTIADDSRDNDVTNTVCEKRKKKICCSKTSQDDEVPLLKLDVFESELIHD